MAQELARKQGTFLNLSDRTLGRALQSEHKLESTELARGKYTIRKHIQGHRHNVLCMLATLCSRTGSKNSPNSLHERQSGESQFDPLTRRTESPGFQLFDHARL